MDIKIVKQQADERTAQQEEIRKNQDKAESEFERLFKVSGESDSIWNAKMIEATNQFINDFKEYFEQNGFSTTCGNPFGNNGTITEIEATYSGSKFKLSEINYDGEEMHFSDYDVINERICIALPRVIPNYFVWKDNIAIGKKRLVDMEGTPVYTYKDFIKKLDTSEELKELLEKIEININHFQNAISNASTINLCIYRFKTDSTYRDFKEFIEAV